MMYFLNKMPVNPHQLYTPHTVSYRRRKKLMRISYANFS